MKVKTDETCARPETAHIDNFDINSIHTLYDNNASAGN